MRFTAPTSALPTEPGFLYHATAAEHLHDIARGGLKPHRPSYGTDQDAWPDGGEERRSYFSPRAGAVWAFAPVEDAAVVIRVPPSSVKFHTERYTGDVFTRERVPPAAIEVLTDDGWVPLRTILDGHGRF